MSEQHAEGADAQQADAHATDAHETDAQEAEASEARSSLLSNSFWIAFSEVIKAVAEGASALVAARVLTQEDFGLMGAVLLLLAVLNALTQTGFDQALIQRKDNVDRLLNVAWTWHVIRGLGLAGLVAAVAPLVADWYAQPALLLLIWVSTARLIGQGFQNIGLVFFQRQLDFKKICAINGLRAFAQAGVAIPAILITQNVWGLMAGLVAEAVVALIVSYVAHPYRPRLAWDWEQFRELTRFGKWITGLTVMLFIITQGDDIFVSKYLGLAALGLYQMAYLISNLPATKVTHVLSKVSFSSYARLQDQPQELRRAFTSVMRTTLLLSGPLCVLLAMCIPDVVAYIISPKWAPIVPLVRILVISAFFRSFAALAGPLFRALDKPEWDLRMNLPRFVVLVVGIWPACAMWGLEGACWVVSLAIATCLPTWFYGVRKLIGLEVWAVFRLNALALVSTLVFAGTLFGARWALGGTWYLALASLLVGVAAWLAVMAVLGKLTRRLDLIGELRTLQRSIQAMRSGG